MKIFIPKDFEDYELLDSGDGKRLERFGEVLTIRPDPQCIWKPNLTSEWKQADAIFEGKGDKGSWVFRKKVDRKIILKYKKLKFYLQFTPFKHTGVFPEQAVWWDFISEAVGTRLQKNNNPKSLLPNTYSLQPSVLNLFGYTGISSLAAAQAGATVTHIDASYPTIGWARENQALSNLTDKPIRFILEDSLKFVEREIRRGNKYDGIILDPPVYGHGPKGERWDFNEHFPILMEKLSQILTSSPLFVIVNTYAISSSSLMLENVLKDYLGKLNGTIESGELALKDRSGRLLSTGIFGIYHG